MSREADEEILNIDTSLRFRDTGGVFQQSILVPPGTLLANTNMILPLTDGTSGQVFAKGAGNATEWINNNGENFSEFWILKEVQPSGTNGGTFSSGVWNTRNLNTLIKLPGTGIDVTLSSNQITIQDGTYRCYCSAPAYNVRGHQAKLRNITDGVDVITGTSEYTQDTQTISIVEGTILVTGGPKVFELQHRSTNSATNLGFGRATGFGTDETYSIVYIQKIS